MLKYNIEKKIGKEKQEKRKKNVITELNELSLSEFEKEKVFFQIFLLENRISTYFTDTIR